MGLGFQGHVFEGCFDFEKFGVFLICLRVDLLRPSADHTPPVAIRLGWRLDL